MGILNMPLHSQAASGAQYSLSGTVDLEGPSQSLLSLDGTESFVEIALVSGEYSAFLQPDWELSRETAQGPQNVEAQLSSASPQMVDITEGETTSLQWHFLVEGEPLILENRGTLAVDFVVEELPPGALGVCAEATTEESNCASSLFFDTVANQLAKRVFPSAPLFATPVGNLLACFASFSRGDCSVPAAAVSGGVVESSNGNLSFSGSFEYPPSSLVLIEEGAVEFCTVEVGLRLNVEVELQVNIQSDGSADFSLFSVSVEVADATSNAVSGPGDCTPALDVIEEFWGTTLVENTLSTLSRRFDPAFEFRSCETCDGEGCVIRCGPETEF